MADSDSHSPTNSDQGNSFEEFESNSSVVKAGLLLNENKVKKPEDIVEDSDSTESEKDDAKSENNDWEATSISSSDSDSDDKQPAPIKLDNKPSTPRPTFYGSSFPSPPVKPISSAPATFQNMSKDDEQKKRRWYKRKFQELRGRGIEVRSFSDHAPLAELKEEYDDLVDEQKKKNGISLQKNILVTVVSLIEMANTRYDPFKLDLQGWSESFHENIDSMDEILEELYEKYYNQFMINQMPVEARLIVTVAFSALTFHFTKAYFTPERMRNIHKAQSKTDKKMASPPPPQQSSTKDMPGPTGIDGELFDEWLRKQQDSIPNLDELQREEQESPKNKTHRMNVNV